MHAHIDFLIVKHRPTQPRQWISVASVGLVLLMLIAFIWTVSVNEFSASVEKVEMRLSMTLPRIEDQVFVGREKELKQIMRCLNSSTRIISITRSPGFGKSSLAIHAGYRSEKLGITVYYVDLSQLSNMKSLRMTLKDAVSWEDGKYYSSITEWLKQLNNESLLVMDNCDLILHKQKDSVQNFLKSMKKRSSHLRILLTAQQVTSFIGSFRPLSIKELNLNDAIVVLQSISSKIALNFAKKLAKLVGEVPLALQIVGTLLKEQSSETLYNALKHDLIQTLSPEELPPDERIATTLNISYHYLTFRFQVCGRILANFPGSFHSDVARDVLKYFGESKHPLPGPWEHSDTEQCLDILRRRSLLSVNWHRRMYSFHQLIRNFFKFNQEKEDQHPWITNPEILFETAHVKHYLADLSALYRSVLETSEETEAVYRNYLKFHDKRESYHFPYEHMERYTDFNMTGISTETFNTTSVLVWKIFVIINADLVRKANAELYLLIATYETASTFQRIHLKNEGPVNYFSQYVNFLITLCKLECGLHNSSFALKNYKMKYKVVREFYLNTKTVEEAASDSFLIKYLSRLAHLYLIENELNSFMESWQDILHIRMKKCQKTPCNKLNLGLKAFGNKNYALTIKYLQPYLNSSSISLTRKARIFVLVHHSHVMEGNLAKAQQMLEDGFKIKHKVYHIIPVRPALCHTYDQSCEVTEEVEVPLGHLLLHTNILYTNYRTCMILAKFFIHWKKYGVGRELMNRVFFFLNIQNDNYWQPKGGGSKLQRSTLIEILYNKHLQKLLIK